MLRCLVPSSDRVRSAQRLQFNGVVRQARVGAVGLLTHVLSLVPVLFLSRRPLVKSADHPYRCPLPLSPNCNTQSRRSFRSPVRSLKALKALKTQETHGKRRVDKVAGRRCNRARLKADLDGLVGAECRLLDGHMVS